jgi:hypothetical protein
MASEAKTGARDVTYNLVSNLYHSLKGADACDQYIRDAQESGDRELEEFFRDCQEQNRDLAERAKNLLGAKLGQLEGAGQGASSGKEGSSAKKSRKMTGGRELKTQTNASVKSGGKASDDVEDEMSKESFPASDAPAKY